jgi:molybdopterin/thiamine biosynthesis adenylyltransferase/rhodanese-related sulfurtransferase/molybdopterin converting factor small subunit
MPEILLPTPLRPFAGGAARVPVNAESVGQALAALVSRHAELQKHLYDDSGRLRSFVNVYKNDQDVRYLEREATRLAEGDVLSIVPSIAGGSVERNLTDHDAAALSNDEIRRYSRHLIMPEVGMEGQKKLKAARVLAIGAGGLGSPLTLSLAAAGVGTIGLVDFDVVEDSNLQRQILFGTKDVGRPKLSAAAERLRDVNPNVTVEPHETRLTSGNALEIFRGYDVIADGTDNFPTRYLVNDACVLTGKPNVYASIFRFEGQASVFWAEKGPCYRCLYPEPPPPGLVPSCAEGGVLGILPGLLGVIQATETIKLILRDGEPLIGRLLLVDALTMRFREMSLRRDPRCVVCGPEPSVRGLIDYEDFCARAGGGIRVPAASTGPATGVLTSRPVRASVPEITVEELKALRDRGESVVLLDVREPHEIAISDISGSVKIPLGTLPQSVDRLSKDDAIVAYCRVGGRSAKAVEFLQQKGYSNVRNLVGGINRWAERIDPSMAKY